MRDDSPKTRSALDAQTAVCLHIQARWPGASQSERRSEESAWVCYRTSQPKSL
jgi:hypothetical protein